MALESVGVRSHSKGLHAAIGGTGQQRGFGGQLGDFRAVPLEHGHGVGQTAQQRIRPAFRGLGDGHDAHFGSAGRHRSAERVRQQLVA